MASACRRFLNMHPPNINTPTNQRALNMQHAYIDGIKSPVEGQGGASFANDGRSLFKNNATFKTR